MGTDTPTLLEQLSDRHSPRRRAAAKRLGRTGDPAAGPALLGALRDEVADARTWETQYEMALALGLCGHREALPFLRELAGRPFAATAVSVAVGESVVRLADDPARAVVWCLGQGPEMLADGALRGMARLGLVPDEPVRDAILDFVERTPGEHHLRYWPAVAAARWPGRRARSYLKKCAPGPREDVAEAARVSLARAAG
ncbi:HEAT repeat domain-containing protein [Streptomyces sp. NPDC002523]